MNIDLKHLVEVEYDYPGSGHSYSIGEMFESTEHIVLVHLVAKGADLYSYMIIPKKYIAKIRTLKRK
jgi:hypothetical protein